MKSEEIILAEIEKLKALKPTLRRTSSFGDDHHDAVDAQIEVLENKYNEDKVFDLNDGASEDEPWHANNVRDAGLEAARWAHDEEFGNEKAPSEEWAPLCEK